MKLRNKKTGEIITIGHEIGDDFDGVGLVLWFDHAEGPELDDQKIYGSLAELNEDWEDYKPAEPLIKDKKIRKAVRAWAEAEGIKEVAVLRHLVWGEEMTEIARTSNFKQEIIFKGDLGIKFGDYTITELCGEEEQNAGEVKRYEPGMPQRVVFERMKQDLRGWIEKNKIDRVGTSIHTEPDGRRSVQFIDETNAGDNRLTIIGWPTIGLSEGAIYTPDELLITEEEE